jgi:hypothetical protein
LEAIRPFVLGALLDAVVVGLRRQNEVRLPCLPRMADHTVWVEACTPALGWTPNDYLNLDLRNRGVVEMEALGLCPVTPTLLAFLEEEQVFEGTYEALRQKLENFVGQNKLNRPRDWPSNAKSLSVQIQRVAPNLRQVGVEVEKLTTRSAAGFRVRITRRPAA